MYKVTHFFGCRGANDDLFPYMLCELAENGIENVVLAHIWCQRYVGEPEYKNLVAKAIADAKLTVWGSHAPFGKIWDLDTPDTLACYHPVTAILYSANSANVRYTMVAGRFLKREGRLVMDTDDLFVQARGAQEELLRRGRGKASVFYLK